MFKFPSIPQAPAEPKLVFDFSFKKAAPQAPTKPKLVFDFSFKKAALQAPTKPKPVVDFSKLLLSRKAALQAPTESKPAFNSCLLFKKPDQMTAQQIATQQQEQNEKYSRLLIEYQELLQAFIAEKNAHAQETADLIQLRAEISRISDILKSIGLI